MSFKTRSISAYVLPVLCIMHGCKKTDVIQHKIAPSDAAHLVDVSTHTLNTVDTDVSIKNTQTTSTQTTATATDTVVYSAHVLIRNATTEDACNAAKGKWTTNGTEYKCEQTVESCLELGADIIIDPDNRSHCIHGPVPSP